MNRRTLVTTIVAVVATVLSVFIGGRAIMGTAATLRHSSRTSSEAPGSIEITGGELEALLEDLAEASTSGNTEDATRDPMVPYRAPRVATPSRPSAPATSTYKVTAVFIDADPTAVLIVNGTSVIAHIGDEVEGGHVVKIERDGVTIEGDKGERKIEYKPSNQ